MPSPIGVGNRAAPISINPTVARVFSSGLNVPTATSGGPAVLATYDTLSGTDPWITLSSASPTQPNTRMTIALAGDYEYGFSLRTFHSGAGNAGGGDLYMYVLLNGAIQILGCDQKAVGASGVFYIDTAEDVRTFQVGDYLEVWILNNMGTSLVESPTGEHCRFWCKRTVGPT